MERRGRIFWEHLQLTHLGRKRSTPLKPHRFKDWSDLNNKTHALKTHSGSALPHSRARLGDRAWGHLIAPSPHQRAEIRLRNSPHNPHHPRFPRQELFFFSQKKRHQENTQTPVFLNTILSQKKKNQLLQMALWKKPPKFKPEPHGAQRCFFQGRLKAAWPFPAGILF